MPSRDSRLELSRLAIGVLLLISLVASFLLSWRAVEQQANRSALQLASQRIHERASFYKQQWLLARKANSLEIAGLELNYTDKGWVTPLNNQQRVDCQYWLAILYPDEELLGHQPLAIDNESIARDYRCIYRYSQDRFIAISLIQNNFSAQVGFLIQ